MSWPIPPGGPAPPSVPSSRPAEANRPRASPLGGPPLLPASGTGRPTASSSWSDRGSLGAARHARPNGTCSRWSARIARTARRRSTRVWSASRRWKLLPPRRRSPPRGPGLSSDGVRQRLPALHHDPRSIPPEQVASVFEGNSRGAVGHALHEQEGRSGLHLENLRLFAVGDHGLQPLHGAHRRFAVSLLHQLVQGAIKAIVQKVGKTVSREQRSLQR